MRELLERLCALNAVSSWEDEVRAFLLAEVEHTQTGCGWTLWAT